MSNMDNLADVFLYRDEDIPELIHILRIDRYLGKDPHGIPIVNDATCLCGKPVPGIFSPIAFDKEKVTCDPCQIALDNEDTDALMKEIHDFINTPVAVATE
jgi:hypothetical protein